MRAASKHGDWMLAADGVTLVRGRSPVLEAVDLEVRPGDCVSIIGPNGAGKSTLVLALLGLLKPAAGTVQLDEKPVAELSPQKRSRFMAYVPQTLDAPPAFSVYDVVAGGRHAFRASWQALTPADREAVDTALELCRLNPLRGRKFPTLSGGERQKTLIAAALAQTPSLLVLDEPNAALDPAVQLELVRILQAWRGADGRRALVVVSHDLQLPAALGGRLLALRAGQVVADGPTSELLQPEMLEKLYEAPFGVATTAEGRQLVLPNWWHELTSS